ncbi:MAG: UDP-N-acetylmuramoyl-L-alanyl-D-glutamate--2,6-diaminopimelate ligase [Candidatus Aminicenantales bacterium]
MKLNKLLNGVPVLHVSGNRQVEIRGIACSSKKLMPRYLFAALKGLEKDGFDYVKEALTKGAAAILSERPKLPEIKKSWIQVYDSREALALCSANFYDHPSHKMKMVGITGTKGKTTITYLLEEIIRRAGGVPGVIGTVSYRWPSFHTEARMTTPEAPDMQCMMKDMAEHGTTHCLIEVSSHSLEQKRVWGISFDVAVFTNLSGEHLDYHHSMEDYFEAKKRLFSLNSKKRTAVVNEDDPWGKRLISELPMTTITFGLEPSALVRGERYRFNGSGIEAIVRYPGGQTAISSSLTGKYNLYNILAAFAIALALNIPPQAIQEGIASLRQIPGRFEKIDNRLGLQIYVDYAHTDNALKNLLEAVRDLKPSRILLIFGAGGDRDKSKRERMGEVAATYADWIFLTSDNPRSEDPLAIIQEIEKGILKAGAKKYTVMPDRREAIEKALTFGKKGDYILVVGKGHENYQILKNKTISFSDAEVIKNILKKLEPGQHG